MNYKKFFTVIAFLGAVSATQAQVTVYTSNPADSLEYGEQFYAAAANFQNQEEEQGTRSWVVEMPIGNNALTMPKVWKAYREGLYFAGVASVSNFDNTTSWGGGAEIGYLRKYWGFSVTGTYSQGYPDKTSDDQTPFTQLDMMARLFLPGLEFRLLKDGTICRIIPYVEGNWKKAKFVVYDDGTSVTTTETADEWIITTTKTSENLDARPHVWGYAGGLRIEVDPWGSPLFFYATADYGRSQRFTYLRDQWHNQFKASIGIGIRLFNNHGYTKSVRGSKNKYLYEDYGYTRDEVKKHNW
jgi:hypothetical protein